MSSNTWPKHGFESNLREYNFFFDILLGEHPHIPHNLCTPGHTFITLTIFKIAIYGSGVYLHRTQNVI